MRISHRYLTFDRNKKLNQLLDKLQIPYKEEEKSFGEGVSYYGLEFFLYEDDHSFQDKTKEVSKFKINPQIGTEFSKADEDNANWFMISTGQFGYPQPEDKYFELTYANDNVCPQCQIGKRQLNPFRLRSEPKAKHSEFMGLNWIFDEIFVRGKAIEIFDRENVTGIRYSSAILNKTKEPIASIKQLHVDTILLPALLTENLNFEICQRPTDKKQILFFKKNNPSLLDKDFCGQKKYNYPTRGAITFKKEMFENQPDFVRTFEWFGSGGSASRPILVSKKVRIIIMKEKLRGAFLRPIFLV
jgi:hypothetical protein